MMSSLFGITASDIQNKITPSNSEQVFLIGDEGDISSVTVDSIVETQESRLLSHLPERERRLIRRVEDEILTEYATEGQTSFQLGLYPLDESSLKLYKNYSQSRSYFERTYEDAVSTDDYTVDADTGVITFVEGLRKGDRLYAEYNHSAAQNFLYLKETVITMTVIELSKRFNNFRDNDGYERFDSWEEEVNNYLMTLRKSASVGIDEIDQIKLRSETRTTRVSKHLRF